MRPIASLSLDLDDKWSYLKTHGNPEWEAYPSYLDLAIPRILEFLKNRNLFITFFIVGQDAAFEKNHTLLRSIAEAGHEIGNHSFHHEPWLHLYTEDKLSQELTLAEKHIEQATSKIPIGFRGPGFSVSENTLRVLAKKKYLYDATVFPNVLNPLARAYFFATSRLSKEEKRQRKALFGTFFNALYPVKPYQWQLEERKMLEIPVTTMPLFKIPIHLSYILYLSKYSRILAVMYFKLALMLCRLTATHPSMLLHPLDFLGFDDMQDLSFFPGMTMESGRKIDLVDTILKLLSSEYEIVTMRRHAELLIDMSGLPNMEPRFN